jgi:hypothetical protein
MSPLHISLCISLCTSPGRAARYVSPHISPCVPPQVEQLAAEHDKVDDMITALEAKARYSEIWGRYGGDIGRYMEM